MLRQAQDAGLRRQCLGFKEVLGASLGGMGLSGTVIIGVPIVLTKGGPFTPLIFLTAMCAFLLVAVLVNVFAGRIATPGSLCDYVKAVFGARTGAVTGWALFLGYAAAVPAYLASVPFTLISIFHGHGGAVEPGAGELVATAVTVAVLASLLTIRNVAVSTRVTLAVDAISLGLLAMVAGKYMPAPRELFDGMLSGEGKVGHGWAGLALAMVCFTGFEAASVFGVEAKRPLIIIPRANLATVLVTGVVMVFASGAVIGAFHRAPLGIGNNPFVALVGVSDLQWGLPIILGAAALSWFGCLLACLNTAGRLLYTLALQGGFWRGASRIHPRFATPFIAIIVIAAFGMATTGALIFAGIGAMDILVGSASLASIGCLIAYALVSAAAVVDRWGVTGHWGKLAYALTGAVAIALMLFAMVGLMIGLE